VRYRSLSIGVHETGYKAAKSKEICNKRRIISYTLTQLENIKKVFLVTLRIFSAIFFQDTCMIKLLNVGLLFPSEQAWPY